MDFIEASGLSFSQLNETIRHAGKECRICACQGQRFIAAGMSSKRQVEIDGIPGNALGAYLGGGTITVNGNAQDAVGDTMSAGRIVIHGSTGDAAGYAMRGGEIFIQDNAGYRAGIHMKAYKQHKPVIVIGGRAGSFLGEYQAGGLILVLGLHTDGQPITVHFPLHRNARRKNGFPRRRVARAVPGAGHARMTPRRKDMAEFAPYVREYCRCSARDAEAMLRDTLYRYHTGQQKPLSADVFPPLTRKAGAQWSIPVDEIRQYTAEEDVKFLRMAFCDVIGSQKNISILPDAAGPGVQLRHRFDASAIPGFGDEVHSDLFLHPDSSTLCMLPWRPDHGRVARMFCHVLRPDGAAFEADSRALLHQAVADAGSAGHLRSPSARRWSSISSAGTKTVRRPAFPTTTQDTWTLRTGGQGRECPPGDLPDAGADGDTAGVLSP